MAQPEPRLPQAEEEEMPEESVEPEDLEEIPA